MCSFFPKVLNIFQVKSEIHGNDSSGGILNTLGNPLNCVHQGLFANSQGFQVKVMLGLWEDFDLFVLDNGLLV